MDELIDRYVMHDMIVGYAAAAYAAGYRADDRTMIGMILSVSDEDLDFICNLLEAWERAEG